ncbi:MULTISPECIES: hypothetical protein [unclassified Caballeronia]|uniref:hypothetical protein n=1 Tax=unclassified Caballeronia TaxID=2646786 RepID=UPI00202858AA|nr:MULTISPECIES: hypothetical protein [unclassified Caballeronia]
MSTMIFGRFSCQVRRLRKVIELLTDVGEDEVTRRGIDCFGKFQRVARGGDHAHRAISLEQGLNTLDDDRMVIRNDGAFRRSCSHSVMRSCWPQGLRGVRAMRCV